MTRKPSPIHRVGSAGILPKQFPKLPEEFIRKFKELEGVNQELTEFWYDVISVLQADSEEIRRELNEAKNEIAALRASIQ